MSVSADQPASGNRVERSAGWVAIPVALLLLWLGIRLAGQWTGTVADAWVWSLVALGVFGGVLLAQRRIDRFGAGLRNPWLWLALALVCSVLVLPLGVSDYGAVRHFGESWRIRSGLWALVALIPFVALLAQREALGWGQQAAAVVGLLVIFCALLMQPDFYSALLMVLVVNLAAWRARNAMRYWVPVATVVSAVAGVVLLAMGPAYHRQRLWELLHPGGADPLHRGWEPLVFSQARGQAGWTGLDGPVTDSAMFRLPIHPEWYTPGYVDAWGGLLAQVAVVVLLLAFAGLVWWQGRRAANATRRIVRAGLGMYLFVVCVAWLSYNAGVLPAGGGYGLPFVGAGQASVAAMLLLTLVMLQTREPDARSRMYSPEPT